MANSFDLYDIGLLQIPPSPQPFMRESVVAFCAQKAKMLTILQTFLMGNRPNW
jgi:hypothetical protein